MVDAACKEYPTNLFFPAKGDINGQRGAADQIEKAKRVCAGCPVLLECQRFILAEHPRYEDDFGIYGGWTPEERHRVRFEARNQRQRERRKQLREQTGR